jgi:DNA-binding CsgD family transcriptional regulator
MEQRLVTNGVTRLPRPSADLKPRHIAYTQNDRERALAFAESVTRSAFTLEESLQVADQAFVAGLAAASRGEFPAGAHHLTKALIASALAAWQLNQLSEESSADVNFFGAQARRSAAEAQLQMIPFRVRLAVTALRVTSEGEAMLPALRATLAAFVFGCGVGRAVLNGPRLLDWQRSFIAAFEGTRDETSKCDVAGLGLPRAVQAPPSGDLRRVAGHDARPRLSVREREVLSQIVGGLTTAEVALRLGVKTTTVATLVGRIFNKLGVNNRAAAVGIALSYGLCATYEEGNA